MSLDRPGALGEIICGMCGMPGFIFTTVRGTNYCPDCRFRLTGWMELQHPQEWRPFKMTPNNEAKVTERKYLVIPGSILSRNDDDIHFIGAPRLMRLYGVKPEQCIVGTEYDAGHPRFKGMVVLRPKYDGDYTLPRAEGRPE